MNTKPSNAILHAFDSTLGAETSRYLWRLGRSLFPPREEARPEKWERQSQSRVRPQSFLLGARTAKHAAQHRVRITHKR